MSRDPVPDRCGRCRHFVDGAAELERLLPGLLALSSGQGDSRGDQGVCRLHQRMLIPTMTCRRFAPRDAAPAGRPGSDIG